MLKHWCNVPNYSARMNEKLTRVGMAHRDGLLPESLDYGWGMRQHSDVRSGCTSIPQFNADDVRNVVTQTALDPAARGAIRRIGVMTANQ
jgi:hypothetical protein